MMEDAFEAVALIHYSLDPVDVSSRKSQPHNVDQPPPAVFNHPFSDQIRPRVYRESVQLESNSSERIALNPLLIATADDDEHRNIVPCDWCPAQHPCVNRKEATCIPPKLDLEERIRSCDELEKRLYNASSWKVKFMCLVLLTGIILVSLPRAGVEVFLNAKEVVEASSNQSSPSITPTDSTTIGAASSTFAETEQSSIQSENQTLAPPLITVTRIPSLLDPTAYEDETIFYAIGDVPYLDSEKIQLRDRMMNLPDNGEFLIHVGDIRSGKNTTAPCKLEEYQEVRDILLQSKIPVFIIPGDNEWVDCPNYEEAKSFWRETFNEFDKNWDHGFQVVRHPSEPENFYFTHKRTLYIGLNMVGGQYRGYWSHSSQLEYECEVVKDTVNAEVVFGDAVNVVMFGHAFPAKKHRQSFFNPLKDYIEANLNNTVPIMYLNGDKHFYQSQENYMDLSNFHRLQVDSGATRPPLKVTITASRNPDWSASDAFAHDRML